MLINPTNFGSMRQGGNQFSDKEDKNRKRHEMERENIILEADSRRLNTRKGEMEAGIRELQKEKQRLEINIQERERELKKITAEISDIQGQIDHLKKQINILV